MDVAFPAGGVEVAHAYSTPPPRTTPDAQNVRLYEPLHNRARGGSRPGLAQYLPSPDGTSTPLQHLNYIVDPSGSAVFYSVDYQLGDYTQDFVFVPFQIDLEFDDPSTLGDGYYVRDGGDIFQPPPRATRQAVRIIWADPADMSVGDTLSGVQLNAAAQDAVTAAPVAGVFVYSPPSGTVMSVAGRQALSVVFTPTLILVYRQAARTVHVNVRKRPLTITALDQEKDQGVEFTFAGTEFTASGLQPGDSVTSVTLSSAGAAAAAPEGAYPITPSAAVGTGLGDYEITYADGTLFVGAAGWAAVEGAGNQGTTWTVATSSWSNGSPFSQFSGDVLPGDLIVVCLWKSAAAINVFPADNWFNTYHQVGSAQGSGGAWRMELWYAVAVAEPPTTDPLLAGLAYDLSQDGSVAYAIQAYRTPTEAPAPDPALDDFSQQTGASADASTGAVGASQSRTLLVGYFATAAAAPATAGAGFNPRAAFGPVLLVDALAEPPPGEEVTLDYDGAEAWAAAGASFMPE